MTFGFTEKIFKDSLHLTLLPLKSAGVLPISVAGNLSLWQALSKSSIHLNISDNLTNVWLQHCEALQPHIPIIPEVGKRELEFPICPMSLQFDYRPKNCTQQERAPHLVILNTEFFMSRFQLLIQPLVTIFKAYFIKHSAFCSTMQLLLQKDWARSQLKWHTIAWPISGLW